MTAESSIPIDVHNAHIAVKAKRTLAACIMHTMKFDDRPEEAKRLERARLKRGFDSAKAAAEFFGWNYNSYAQHENGGRGIGRSVDRYAAAFGVSAGWLLTGVSSEGPRDRVELMGFVGAGQEVYQFDEGGAGDVEAPPGVASGTVAVEVRGESMLPLYEDGTILYYSRQLPPENMVGRRCITRLADDRVLVKTLSRGSERGLWTLLSLNAPPIEDVALVWAAPIDWVKPRS